MITGDREVHRRRTAEMESLDCARNLTAKETKDQEGQTPEMQDISVFVC